MEYHLKGVFPTEKISLYNCDNMELMKQTPDNYYDLAIVDPPYGLGKKLAHDGSGKNAQSKFSKDFHSKQWDNSIPDKEYFEELFRVSKNQIIWGGNYFLDYLTASRGMIAWDKMVFIPTMSRVEYAWVSFDRLPELVQINNNDKNRMHLTQKPAALYKWLLQKYAKPNDKILDTHLGSMSIAIACHDMGFELVGCELDSDYFNNGVERVKKHVSQLSLFAPEELTQKK